MKLLLLLASLAILLAGCSKRPIDEELSFEVFPGIFLKPDPKFLQFHEGKAGFYFTVFLENRTEQGISLHHWEAKLTSTNLGNGTSSFSKISAEKAFIESGRRHPLRGYLYLGPPSGHKYPERSFAKAVGTDENHLSTMSSKRSNGDCLLGLEMSIQVGDDRESGLYLVKYHFDEDEDTIQPYYVLGNEESNELRLPSPGETESK